MDDETSPLLRAKAYDQSSVFKPANLLREGRRQRGRPDIPVPAVCLLDPDGDIVRHLTATGRATEHPGWACYHTTLWTTALDPTQVGVIGCAVGASFAVLLAEQLAVSGCELLISVTSSGSITQAAEPPYFVLIDRALRDEGTSHHYLPPSTWSPAPSELLARLDGQFDDLAQPVVTGATWTTDAPYRETTTAIAHAESLGIVAVEMEAAALYAFATAKHFDVICVAHVTNSMATEGDDFEKGEVRRRPRRPRSRRRHHRLPPVITHAVISPPLNAEHPDFGIQYGGRGSRRAGFMCRSALPKAASGRSGRRPSRAMDIGAAARPDHGAIW